jgi:hypothetical protein
MDLKLRKMCPDCKWYVPPLKDIEPSKTQSYTYDLVVRRKEYCAHLLATEVTGEVLSLESMRMGRGECGLEGKLYEPGRWVCPHRWGVRYGLVACLNCGETYPNDTWGGVEGEGNVCINCGGLWEKHWASKPSPRCEPEVLSRWLSAKAP